MGVVFTGIQQFILTILDSFLKILVHVFMYILIFVPVGKFKTSELKTKNSFIKITKLLGDYISCLGEFEIE